MQEGVDLSQVVGARVRVQQLAVHLGLLDLLAHHQQVAHQVLVAARSCAHAGRAGQCRAEEPGRQTRTGLAAVEALATQTCCMHDVHFLSCWAHRGLAAVQHQARQAARQGTHPHSTPHHTRRLTLAGVDDLSILADVVAAQVGGNGVRHLPSCQVGVAKLAPHSVLVHLGEQS